jgi:flagellar biosynthesis protein FliP
MKKRTLTNSLIHFTLALALTMIIWSPLQSQATEPVKGKSTTDSKMMEGCQEMMKKKQEMMAEMKAQDVELTAQVEMMNSAPGDKKLDLAAAVVTRMVEQRTAMHARKSEMQEEMMTHMMRHMQMGKESMSKCPMIKGMGGMKRSDE